MTTGQTFNTTNGYCKNFYKEVIKVAKEVGCQVLHPFSEDDMYLKFVAASQPQLSANPDSPQRYVIDSNGTEEAARDLCEFIDLSELLDAKKGPRRPHLIFAFDES